MGTHPIFESDFDCLTEMPFLKSLQVKKEPLWHTWDREAQKEGLRDTVYFVNGDYYCGQWKNDQRSGAGVNFYHDQEGAYYDGNWELDQRHGKGKMFFADKSVYDGDWRDDLQNGFGTIYFPNGDMYEGHWKGGKKHGDGEFHFQSRAQILKGTWSEGISKCGELFEMKDKTKATNPFKYPIPKIELVDPRDVLAEAKSRVAK